MRAKDILAGLDADSDKELTHVKRDDSNIYVALAQWIAAILGYYTGKIDSKFGPITEKAITDIQLAYKLPVTGEVDEKTWLLFADLCAEFALMLDSLLNIGDKNKG